MTKYFVVKTALGHESYSFEFDDFPQSKAVIYRAEFPAGDETSLDDAVSAYKRGVRLKAMPKPPVIEKPKDKNSVKERYLAKLRASESAASALRKGPSG